MNRTTMMARLEKLEGATRTTGRVHTIDARSHDGDRAKVEAQFETEKAALIASSQAGPDDLFVCFATFYEPAPAWRPAPPATAWAEPAVEADDVTQAERMERLSDRAAAVAARTAPPAAERPRDLSRDRHGENGRHAAIVDSSRVHPAIGRA